MRLKIRICFFRASRITALGAEPPLLTMPELYRRLSSDVNQPDKRLILSLREIAPPRNRLVIRSKSAFTYLNLSSIFLHRTGLSPQKTHVVCFQLYNNSFIICDLHAMTNSCANRRIFKDSLAFLPGDPVDIHTLSTLPVNNSAPFPRASRRSGELRPRRLPGLNMRLLWGADFSVARPSTASRRCAPKIGRQARGRSGGG